jgi:hypothetical protein
MAAQSAAIIFNSWCGALRRTTNSFLGSGYIKRSKWALPTCFFLAFGYRIEAIIRFTKIQDAEFKRNYVAGSPDRLGGRGYSDEVLSGASRLRNYV